MTKAVSFLFVFFFLLVASQPLCAQVNPTDLAVAKAIENQADTISLRQKIVDARATEARGDLAGAAKRYEEAYTLTQKIGSGIDVETAQTIAGLVRVRLALAKQAQDNGDYIEADGQVQRVLKVAPHDPEAIAFKAKNDAILKATEGRRPDVSTLGQVPQIQKDKQDAGTLVQDGKLLYEAGKFEEAQVKLQQALQLDPDNQAAFYYLNLTKQAFYGRAEQQRVTDNQSAMLDVARAWNPKSGITLPSPNPYVTNEDVNTSPSRNEIYRKLSTIRLDNISWSDGLPLSEVMSYLRDQSKARDPEQKGVNFLFNPNQESAAAATDNGSGTGAPTRIDPQTGLAEAAPAGSGGGGGETVDPSTITIKLTLSDVTLQEALDAIVLVADHPIRYSVGDYGVIFSTKPSGPELPELEMRTFKVDPNTFYQGLQGVTTFTFGAANNSSSGGSGSSGGSSSGSSSGGSNGGGGNGSSVSGAIVPVVDIAGGSNGGGNSGGGGGGGGRSGGGGIVGGGGSGSSGSGPLGDSGVSFLTTPGYMQSVSTAARDFFTAIGINLAAPGRSIAFNDRLGLLFVKATPGELDSIERAIDALNKVAPQVHIKARFIEVSQDDNASLGFDWYLGNFINGSVVASGGSQPSLATPNSPSGYFPGETLANVISGASTDQSLTQGLRNTGPAIATVTGILTDPNFRVVLHALEQRSGVETLAEPEVTTISGRQTQMRATDIQYILTGFDFQQGQSAAPTSSGTP